LNLAGRELQFLGRLLLTLEETVKAMKVAAMMVISMVACGAVAQTSTPTTTGIDSDIALLRSDLQTQRTDVITHTMHFNDVEGEAFWPLYREYTNKQQIIGDQRVSVIKDYAAHYDAIDDPKADELMDRLIKFDEARTKLRAEYYPKFRKAIGAKQAAKFFQVDNRLNLLVDLQLASAIPIIR
jgi:hypothetical protein